MDEEIRKLYEAGMTISDIARKVGIPITITLDSVISHLLI